MKTHCTFAAVSLALAAATSAMATPPSADMDNPGAHAPSLSREQVVADLVAARQAWPSQLPRDGEWYNVPAPLGGMHRMDHRGRMDAMGHGEGPMRHVGSGSPSTLPVRADVEVGR